MVKLQTSSNICLGIDGLELVFGSKRCFALGRPCILQHAGFADLRHGAFLRCRRHGEFCVASHVQCESRMLAVPRQHHAAQNLQGERILVEWPQAVDSTTARASYSSRYGREGTAGNVESKQEIAKKNMEHRFQKVSAAKPFLWAHEIYDYLWHVWSGICSLILSRQDDTMYCGCRSSKLVVKVKAQ